ncbi:glycosyltransferase family 2 protein [Wohlfahrtiimonas larvae]|uniref:Glycosyltransferase family 2 protein n=1 Tax=Wohlfahrtiimonas larvae TaxID=1157986 RepID=A0ABP9MDH3_9GAMM|nr:glycosyltransferase [Wohlfahrtiimonas larvae]
MSFDDQPLVSVIIPCYNHERFVQEAIQSVVDQDYQNIELIIIDDGSKDNSVQKIEEMREVCEKRFVRFEIRYRPNKGLCKTLNEGIEWTRGKYLCTMASDDIWMNYKIKVQVLYLEENHESIGVFGGVKFIDIAGNITTSVSRETKKFNFNDIFLHKHLLPAPTGLCRRDKIVNVGGYDENLVIEDWSMWLKLTEYGGSLDFLNEYFAFYRRHDDNLSSKIDIMHTGRLSIIELYKEHPKYKHSLFNAYIQSFMETEGKDKNLLKKAIFISPIFIFSRKFMIAFKLLLRGI